MYTKNTYIFLQNGMKLIWHVAHENLLLTPGCKTHTHTCAQSQ